MIEHSCCKHVDELRVSVDMCSFVTVGMCACVPKAGVLVFAICVCVRKCVRVHTL